MPPSTHKVHDIGLPLKERVWSLYQFFVEVEGCNTSEACHQTLAFFRTAEPGFDSRSVTSLVVDILDTKRAS